MKKEYHESQLQDNLDKGNKQNIATWIETIANKDFIINTKSSLMFTYKLQQ